MSSSFGTFDCFLLFLITFVALFTRLWETAFPDSVTFDEVYFGNFTNYYLNRIYFHDIHPPLAKLTMAFIAHITGYKGDIIFQKNESDLNYSHDEIYYISLRLTPSVFQSLCFPLIFASLKLLNFKSFTAFAAAFTLIFEPSMLTEGRFILSDGVLHFYTCLHIFGLSLYLSSDKSTKFIVFASLTLGAAISCKHTAFGLIALDGITQILWIYKFIPSIKEIIKRAALFLLPCFSVFILSYVIHFIVLIYYGPGVGYMREEDQITFMKDFSYRGNMLLGSSIFSRIYYLAVLTLYGHMQPMKKHPYESRPEYWPLLLDKVICFSSTIKHTVMCIGSPLIYWPSTASLFLTILSLFIRKSDFRHFLLLCGWSFSYFPFFLIPRSMFLYHYLIPLVFAVMTQSALIETIFPIKGRYFLQWSMIMSGITSFVVWYPFIYGTECENGFEIREWLLNWSKGPGRE